MQNHGLKHHSVLFLIPECSLLWTSQIDCLIKLSGMPDLTLSFVNPRLLDDVSFHPCVRFKRWEVTNDRFHPPCIIRCVQWPATFQCFCLFVCWWIYKTSFCFIVTVVTVASRYCNIAEKKNGCARRYFILDASNMVWHKL